MSRKAIKKRITKKAQPIVMVSKHHYWCLQYLSSVMGLDVNEIVNKYLRETIRDINKGMLKKILSKKMKDNPYALKCIMPRELRLQAEITKINMDLYCWEFSDMVRIAADRAVRAHMDAFPELEKIIRRYDETKKNNHGELQKEREDDTGV